MKKQVDNQRNRENNAALTDHDLDQVVGGSSGNDTIQGSDGNNYINAGKGADVIFGHGGNDIIDGGYGDKADDVAFGGSGHDTFIWGLTGDGNDTFVGGTGNDTVKLDLHKVDSSNIQQALDSGNLTIQLESGEDASQYFDSQGNLDLPPGSSGIITGPDGETLTFTDVEKITLYK